MFISAGLPEALLPKIGHSCSWRSSRQFVLEGTPPHLQFGTGNIVTLPSSEVLICSKVSRIPGADQCTKFDTCLVTPANLAAATGSNPCTVGWRKGASRAVPTSWPPPRIVDLRALLAHSRAPAALPTLRKLDR
jgi:hypothetical protein